MRLRVAEIDQHAVAEIFGDVAAVLRDHLGAGALIGADDLAQVFRIETRGERGRADQIAEHDGQLTALGLGAGGGLRRRGCSSAVRALAIAFMSFLRGPSGSLEILEILLGQIGQDVKIDFVLGKHRCIFRKTDALEPLVDIARHNHHPRDFGQA